MNAKLSAIADKASENLKAQILEADEKLMEAWAACEAEATLNDSPAKFRFAFTVTFDLEKNSMSTDLTFGVRHKLTANCEIPDPNQPQLIAE